MFKVSADLLMDLYIETFKLVLNHTNCQFHKDESYETIWGHQEEIKKDTLTAEVIFSVFVPQWVQSREETRFKLCTSSLVLYLNIFLWLKTENT